RQLPATTKTVGMLKVEVLRNRLLEINPNAEITSIPEIYSPESAESFHLSKHDYVIDAIDSLSNKIDPLCRASATDAVVFSSMGAGLRLDPQKIRVAEFKKVRGCKLASALRQRMKKGEYPKKSILCVYSEEFNSNLGEEALVKSDENS